MLKEELFGHVSQLLKSGDFSKANPYLAKLTKFKDLSPKEKIKISRFYIWVGEPEKAFKVLGKMASVNDLSCLTKETLLLQSRIAFMLNFLGVRYVAKRFYDEIMKIIDKNDNFTNIELAIFYSQLADFHHTSGNFQEAYSAFKQTADLSKQNTERQIFATLGMADNLDGLGKEEEAIQLVDGLIKEVDPKLGIFHAIFYEAKGEYLLRSLKFDQARKSFAKSYELFGNQNNTKDYAYLLYWDAILDIENNQENEAIKKLNIGLELVRKNYFQPALTRKFLVWLDYLGYELSLADKITARFHHSYLSLVGILGVEQYHKQGYHEHPWLQSKIVKTTYDVVVIQNGKMLATNYKDIKAELLTNTSDVIDLFSSCYKKPNSNKFNIMSEIDFLISYALLGSGSLGVNRYSLADYVYRQNFYNIEDGVNRIKSKMKDIQKIISIIKKKDFYFTDYSSLNTVIIFPMVMAQRSSIQLFKKLHQTSEFIRSDVENIFDISSRTAQRLIGEWEDCTDIKKIGEGRNTHYLFL